MDWPSRPGDAPFPALVSFWDGQSEVDSFQAALILGEARYRRANVVLPQSIEIDSWGNVPQLEEWTREYLATREWQSIKEWVKESFV